MTERKFHNVWIEYFTFPLKTSVHCTPTRETCTSIYEPYHRSQVVKLLNKHGFWFWLPLIGDKLIFRCFKNKNVQELIEVT